MIIKRYVFAGFFVMFFVASAAFLALEVCVRMLGDVLALFRPGASFTPVVYFLQLPSIFVQISPVITMMSALFLLTEMLKNHEVRVLEAGGIPSRFLALLFLGAGLLVGIFVFGVNDRLVPVCERRLKPVGPVANLHFTSPGLFLYSARFAPPDLFEDIRIAEGVAPGPIRVIQGREARYRDGRWRIADGRFWLFDRTGKLVREEVFGEMVVTLAIEPVFLLENTRPPEEMSAIELTFLLKRLRRFDIAPVALAAAIQDKIAYPFLNLFILLAGLPFFFWRNSLSRFFVMSFSVLSAFFFYGMYSICYALARNGKVPVFFGAWTVHILLTVVAVAAIGLHGREKSSIITLFQKSKNKD